MIEIEAHTDGGLRVEATNGTHRVSMDEPDQGAPAEALTPKQMLAASLAGCTAMTLKMYAGRKDWPLEDVKVRVTILPADRAEKDAPNRITQTVELVGDLDDAQRERLRVIAGRCPVHRILEGPNVFEDGLAADTASDQGGED